MEISIADQIALDDALVAPADRLKIGKCNLRLSSDVTSKEATLQVVYDVLKLTPFYKAFQVTADAPEIYMQEFWASAYVHNRSVRFKMNNKKHIIGLDQFRDILQICPKVGNKKFVEPPLEKEISRLSSLKNCVYTRGSDAPIMTLDDISWKLSDDDQDDEKAQDDEDEDKNDVNETTQDDEHDDDEKAQDDDDEEQTESEDDGDDFIHPKLTTHDDDIIHEEETDEDDSFDPTIHTPSRISSSDDEDSDNEVEERIPMKYDRIREDQYRNQQFLDSIDEGMKKIIKEQVKKEVSKITPKIEKLVIDQLESEVLIHSGDTVINKKTRDGADMIKNHTPPHPLEQTGGPKEEGQEKNPLLPVLQEKRQPRQVGKTTTTDSQTHKKSLPICPGRGNYANDKCPLKHLHTRSLKQVFHEEQAKKRSLQQPQPKNWTGSIQKDAKYPQICDSPLPVSSNSQGRRVIPFHHQSSITYLEYLRGGECNRKYSTSVTKTTLQITHNQKIEA
ncbi:hypothetical protein Tco_0089200 [Tanacetum coccineum]